MIEITQDEIMKAWGIDNSDTPFVSVRCITYNQEKFISQALDSFLMQKTNFPFEVIVHDDASIDNTANIIREYEKRFPKIVKPIYEKENQYSKSGNVLGKIVDAACKGKYIAICEGDDYWIDENKLQYQVSFLEKNPAYGMCYSKAKQFLQKKKKFAKNILGTKADGFNDLLINGNSIPTLTVCFRRSLLEEYKNTINPDNKGWLMGDYPKWLYFSLCSDIFFWNKVTSVYRVLDNSASHSQSIEKVIEFSKSTYEIRLFFSKFSNVDIPKQDKTRIEFDCYCMMMRKYPDEIIYKKRVNELFFKLEDKSMRDRILWMVSKNKVVFSFLRLLKPIDR